MVYRPHDICSAAFLNDTQRVRLLATREAPGGVIDNDEDPLEDAEEEAIDADPEMLSLLAQYELGDVSEEDEEGGDHAGAEDDVERQHADLALFRRIVRRQRREAALARAVDPPGLLQVGPNPVALTSHGLFFRCAESQAGDREGPPQADNDGIARTTGETALPLRVSWRPSKRSPIRASPLHWAVLGRAHAAIRLLVELGADARQEIRHDVGYGGGAVSGIAPEALAIANHSRETLKVLREAVTARNLLLERRSEEKQSIECRLEQRKARREKERLSREQRRTQEEELEESAYSGIGESVDQEQDYNS
ncbi:unnamed protein product [Phytomonas sp. Hart1]|nr:unnamed protein product [Phytomonas sp. Hart1]|eukprot:CCW69035.1 unnamed protein product [Phytomonas sp. isolate Hart1]